MLARECQADYCGHEIVLAVSYSDRKFASVELKLYVDSQLVDNTTVNFPRMSMVTLRSTLVENRKRLPVKATVTPRMFGRETYRIYIDSELIHQEKAGWIGV